MFNKKSVKVGPYEIFYKECGKGPTFYLLHGFGGNPENFSQVIPHLQTQFKLIIPNINPFFTHPNIKLSFSEIVQIVNQFIILTSSTKDKIHICGSSFGGAICWALCIKNPHKFENTFLINPMPPHPQPKIVELSLKYLLKLSKFPKALYLFLLSPIAKGFLPSIEKIFHVPWVHGESLKLLSKLTHRKAQVIAHVLNRFWWLSSQEDWTYWESRLPYIENKVFIFWGTEDKLFTYNEPKSLEKLIPRSKLIPIPNAGHIAIMEKPIEISQLILNQIQSLDSSQINVS